ncbi:hypothetical protein CAPTEDRAFT_198146 [Capitella teleta]|uniref:Uncharacterized protein n=1 Tax=Capitella teleta TaxID=283909 RepID=X1ZYC0_CAPTE|nr:hypothetical protein CAPTEDRAFT_198146 [Capitella teleta]|eukprot:ELU04695.1 hypothetical protein CAPTEDRAFT_198146 [Capitella teleta]
MTRTDTWMKRWSRGMTLRSDGDVTFEVTSDRQQRQRFDEIDTVNQPVVLRRSGATRMHLRRSMTCKTTHDARMPACCPPCSVWASEANGGIASSDDNALFADDFTKLLIFDRLDLIRGHDAPFSQQERTSHTPCNSLPARLSRRTHAAGEAASLICCSEVCLRLFASSGKGCRVETNVADEFRCMGSA